MAEKMTIEKMSVEMDILWSRIKELELTLSQKLENPLKSTTRKLKRQVRFGRWSSAQGLPRTSRSDPTFYLEDFA